MERSSGSEVNVKLNENKKRVDLKKFNWFRNYKTFSKYGKTSGLFSKNRSNVEFLVLNDYELTR